MAVKTKVTVKFADDVHAAAKAEAARADLTVSEYVEEALRKYLAKGTSTEGGATGKRN